MSTTQPAGLAGQYYDLWLAQARCAQELMQMPLKLWPWPTCLPAQLVPPVPPVNERPSEAAVEPDY